jgi:hypothetical protein
MTDDSPLYAAALILHPKYRVRYIRENWKRNWQDQVLRKVKQLWISYRDKVPITYITSRPTTSYESERPYQDLDEFDRIAQNLVSYTRPSSRDEYDDYALSEPYDIGRQTALSWWCQDQQRSRWPRLSYMAIDILSIPAMSAEPERVFSGARRTISWERASLSAVTIERTECLKHWKRSGILNLDKYELD